MTENTHAVHGMLHVQPGGRLLKKLVVVVRVLLLANLTRKTSEMEAEKGQMRAVAHNRTQTFLLVFEPFAKNIVPLHEERYILTCTPDGGNCCIRISYLY